MSDGEDLEELAKHLVSAGRVTDAAINAATGAGRLREDVLVPQDCFALDAGLDFEGALIFGGSRAEYEAAIAAHPEARTLAAFVAADANRAAMSPEQQVHEFMKHPRWGKRWKVVFAAHVADAITNHGADPSRLPPPIVAALNRVRDFATRAAVKT
jgi:hypothetical protein